MTQNKFSYRITTLTAILTSPESELKQIFLEGLKLLQFDSGILMRIAEDIDLAAKQKKATRLLDRAWYADLTGVIPGLEPYCAESVWEAEGLDLYEGRPRLLDPEVVFLLMMSRAHLDSVTSKRAVDRLRDSIVFNRYLESRGMKRPSGNTVLDALNAVTNETRDYIFRSELEMISDLGLDSMKLVAVDSFSVSGNTQWPTDSLVILNLLKRVYRIGTHRLEKLKLPGFTSGYIPRWLKELSQLNFKLSNTCGKPNSKPKMKKLYRQFLKRANKILLRMINQVGTFLPVWENLDKMAPSRRRMAKALVDRIILDIEGVIRVYSYAGDRVFNGVTLPAPEKILSLSDECAAFIKKGGRDAVIGYKPQVARSENGFITAFEIEPGNPADSSRLLPMINQHRENTGSIPSTVTVDDGYSSRNNRKELKKMTVKTVSIGGSKGKKITPKTEWESQEYLDARNARSAVESIVFVLRYKFHLGEFTRRGISGVTAEFTEKVIAHNLWRIAYLKQKQKKRPAA